MSQSWTYNPLLRPAQVVTGLLALGVLSDVVALGIEADYYTVLQDLDRGIDLPIDEISAAEDRSTFAAVGQLVAYVTAIIGFLVWFRRAYRNTAGLGASGMRFRPGWAVGAWFVPFLNLWRPKQISNDIWRASDPGLPREATGWQGNEVHGLVHWWWALWIVAGLSGNVSTRVYLNAETLSEQLDASAVAIIADVGFVASAVLAMLVVRAITIRQEEREEMLRTTPEPHAPPASQAPPEPQPLYPAG